MHLLSQRSMQSLTIFLILSLTSILHRSTPVAALQLGTRDSPANVLIAAARLHKRGSCCTSPRNPPPDYGPPFTSDPSVDDLKGEITTFGATIGKRSIFYTALGGSSAQNLVEAWACTALDPTGSNFVLFRDLFPLSYETAKLGIIAQNPPSIPLWGKRASWAWAELAEGDTYIAMPEGAQPFAESTWTLYEYPALQRNSGIDHIIRVDPRTGVTSTMWTQGTDPTDTPEPGPELRIGPPIPAPTIRNVM